MEEQNCKQCGKEAKGYKCDMCSEEAETHNESHVCGGSHCVAKCSGCNEAETNCGCDNKN